MGETATRLKVLGILGATWVIGSTTTLVALVAVHARQPWYQFPLGAVYATIIATILCLLGALGLLRLRRPGVTLTVALITFLGVFGILGLFTIGIALLVIGGIIATRLARQLQSQIAEQLAPMLASGAAIAVGLAMLLVIETHPPVLRCLPQGGVRADSGWLFGNDGADTSIKVVGSHTGTTGTIVVGTRSYSFACQGKKIAEFRRV